MWPHTQPHHPPHLLQIAATYPGMQLVLRIRADDPEAQCKLGLKYGADPADAPALLDTATRLGLSVVGVSFHVGSGCRNLAAYDEAILSARRVFDAGIARGHDMRLLDIGGGFTGRFDDHGHVMLGDVARTVNAALAEHFPASCGVRIIAEPGRYFAESSAALLVPVYGVRDRCVFPFFCCWRSAPLSTVGYCIMQCSSQPPPPIHTCACAPFTHCMHLLFHKACRVFLTHRAQAIRGRRCTQGLLADRWSVWQLQLHSV